MTGKELEERKRSLTESLKARAAGLEKKQKEEVCVILIDISGSMESHCKNGDTKIGAVKKALPMLWARGNYCDYGLVAFGSQAYQVQPLTTNFSLVMIQAENLLTQGNTNIPMALRLGRQMMEDTGGEKHRMVLMTDGQNNEETNLMDREVEECVSTHIIVDCIAFGEGADINLLISIAKRTGGMFQSANSPLALKAAYERLNYRVRYLGYKKEVIESR